MKKRKLFYVAIVLMLSIILCSCSNPFKKEAVLSKAYKEISTLAEKSAKFSVDYDNEKDLLELNFSTGSDIDNVFNTLNEKIKDEEIGSIYFRTSFSLENSEMQKLDNGIGNLACKKIKLLGVSNSIAENDYKNWLNSIDKSEILFVPSLWMFKNCDSNIKDKLTNVKKLWIKDESFAGIESFSNVEEIAICSNVDKADREEAEEISTNNFVTKTFGNKTAKAYYHDSDMTYKVIEKTSKAEETTKKIEKPYNFSPQNVGPEEVLPLENLKNLKKITIAPYSNKYEIEYNGSEYIFTLSNVRDDVLINRPNEILSEKSYVPVGQIVLNEKYLSSSEKERIVNEFLELDIKKCYKKSKKFRIKSGKVRINGKSLIYMATPDITDYSGKKKYHSQGKILSSKDIGGKIETPQRHKDYKTFIYIYPTYKRAGVYSKGTKAYSETYHVQIFDLEKKVASKPKTIATAKPPKKFYYYGPTPPAKHSGSVSDKKIFKFIRKLR